METSRKHFLKYFFGETTAKNIFAALLLQSTTCGAMLAANLRQNKGGAEVLSDVAPETECQHSRCVV